MSSAESGRVPNVCSKAASAIWLTVGPIDVDRRVCPVRRPDDRDPDERRGSIRHRQLDVIEPAVGGRRRSPDEIDAVEAHGHRSGLQIVPADAGRRDVDPVSPTEGEHERWLRADRDRKLVCLEPGVRQTGVDDGRRERRATEPDDADEKGDGNDQDAQAATQLITPPLCRSRDRRGP